MVVELVDGIDDSNYSPICWSRIVESTSRQLRVTSLADVRILSIFNICSRTTTEMRMLISECSDDNDHDEDNVCKNG